MDRHIQKIIMGSRWFLVPLYIGLCGSMAVFLVKFFQELYHLFGHVMVCDESQMLLSILSLIDIVLVANLVIMVLISGYETFVTPIKIANNSERPGWLSKLDPGTVKIKLAVSIVSISMIHLLAVYLKVADFPNDKIMWQVLMHFAFVITAVFLAYIDNISSSKHEENE